MGERNLPVKIFSKRENIDEREVEGMGNDNLPKWALEGELLDERVDELLSNLDSVDEILKKRDRNKSFIPITVKAKINEDALAKTHRSKISQIFDYKSDKNVIGMLGYEELIIKIKDSITLDNIKLKLKKKEKNILGISAIEEIEVFKPIINYKNEKGNKVKVTLINFNNYDLDISVANLFEKLCKNEKIRFIKTKYAENMYMYKIELDQSINMTKLESFEGVFSIEDMPIYDETILTIGDEDNKLNHKDFKEGIDYPIVGIMDSGIERNNYLDKWILEEKNSSFIEDDLLKKHGTFVAGIVTYGDELEGKSYTGVEGCRVFDSTVFSEKVGVEEDVLIDNIEKTLKRYGEKIKVWNLSIGTKVEADIDSFSKFAMALDYFQDKYDVIICKSAGNCDGFKIGAPKERISKSADSVRSVVVGSIAQRCNKGDLVEENYPSPFTRVGRGPNYIIKPDLVHYGGNVGIDESGDYKVDGVRSFLPNGKIIEDAGTSFSTPRVSTILAGLQNEINGKFDSLLVKGLAIHSASYPANVHLPISEKINQMGFGVPENINNILYNTPNEITLIMRDQISKGEYIEILDFPFPKNMTENGRFYGQIKVTVLYNSILDSTQGAEYCQSDLKVKLGTYDKKVARDTTKTYIKNPIGKLNPKNILSQTCYSKRSLKSNTGDFANKERLLIQYDDKFCPVKKYVVDLDEMTEANKLKYLGEDRNWFLKIEGLFRDSIIKKSEEKGEDLYEDFCILITIKDSKHEDNPVYNEVTNELENNNFIHSNISLKNTVKLDFDVDGISNENSSELDKLLNEMMENS